LTEGFSQVVILGAGLDSRAARLARAGVRFFEVDQPASHADKQARIVAVADYPASGATYVTCNFETEDFLDRLVASGLDPSRRTFVVWEGVSMYLSEGAVRATLRRVANGLHSGSRLVFDTLGKAMAGGRRLREGDEQMVENLNAVGEPLRWGTDHILPLCFEEGFRRVRSINFEELALAYTGTYERERAFAFSRVTVASREESVPTEANDGLVSLASLRAKASS
jgi:methyltransferase (TIGR00027 family)